MFCLQVLRVKEKIIDDQNDTLISLRRDLKEKVCKKNVVMTLLLTLQLMSLFSNSPARRM